MVSSPFGTRLARVEATPRTTNLGRRPLHHALAPGAAIEISRSLFLQVAPNDGVRLSSPEMLAVNARLLLSIEPENWAEPIRAVWKVRWVAQTNSSNRWNIGVSFTEVSDAAAQRLRELVASRQAN